MEVSFDQNIMKKLKELSEETDLTPEGIIEVVMGQFCSEKGARVYTGRWSGGEVAGEKGMRYVVQWPFRPGFIEATGDLVRKWRNK
jgi:hypothetical protein